MKIRVMFILLLVPAIAFAQDTENGWRGAPWGTQFPTLQGLFPSYSLASTTSGKKILDGDAEIAGENFRCQLTLGDTTEPAASLKLRKVTCVSSEAVSDRYWKDLKSGLRSKYPRTRNTNPKNPLSDMGFGPAKIGSPMNYIFIGEMTTVETQDQSGRLYIEWLPGLFNADQIALYARM